MKAHLLQKPRIDSNWAEHKAPRSLHIVDWDAKVYKDAKLAPRGHGGCCVYANHVPVMLNNELPYTVEIICPSSIDMISTGLRKNAWRKNGVGQCEAILFSLGDNDGDAVLFVETKYCQEKKEDSSLGGYKEDAKQQIKDTIRELQSRGCPLSKRKIYGLISFPLYSLRLTTSVGSPVLGPVEIRTARLEDRINLYVGNRVTYKDSRTIRPA